MRARAAWVLAAVVLLGAGLWWARGIRPGAPALEQDRAAAPVGTSASGRPVEAPEPTRRAPIPATPSVAPASAPAPTHRVVGRVVDERRWPVTGARVTLAREEVATSDGDGGFELLVARAVEERDELEGLVARDANGRFAFTSLRLGEPRGERLAEVDAGTLVLGEGFALRVSVREDGAPAADALVRVDLGHSRQPAGELRTDSAGELLLEALPRGPVHVTATLPGRRGHGQAFVPEERELAVALEPLFAAEVLVVDARSGCGVEGAVLGTREDFFVPAALPGETRSMTPGEFVSARAGPGDGTLTDAEGRARIEGLAHGVRYTVSVEAHGYAPFPRRPASGARLEPGGEPVRIELEPLALRTVRWPIVVGEVPPPPDGTEVQLRHAPGTYGRGRAPPPPPSGRMAGSVLVVADLAGRLFLAEAPDGALASLWCEEGSELGPETSFRRPRRVEVLVRDEEGTPVAGAQAIARNQGNNDLCGWATADDEGLAVLEGLYGGLAEVHVRRPDGAGRGEQVGTLDLDAGDARLEATLATHSKGRARLTLIVDGVPRLPARFELVARGGVRVLDEVPARGELALELGDAAPGASVGLRVDAVGFAPASVTLELPADGSEAVARLELERTAVLVARVTPPAEGRVSILPQRLDPEAGAWGAPPGIFLFSGLREPNGPRGSYVFQGIGPGRWRVLDEPSGASSQPVEVLAGQPEAEVVLDLSAVEWASGRVELDDPEELARVRVRVIDPLAEPVATWRPGSEPPEGTWPREGGFRVQVPGDREVSIVAWHPWLSPDPERGAVTLRGGREGLVLRLVAGDELRLPVPQLGSRTRAIRIARHAGEPTGAPLEWHHAPVVDGVARCALPRGTWTLWVDPTTDFAPLVLRDIAVEGVTVLPPLALEAGSSVRVRLLVPEGQAPPRIGLFASHLGEPEYGRGMNSRGEAVAVLAGLGPGRFRVSYGKVMGSSRSTEREVALDGSSDVELELDLR